MVQPKTPPMAVRFRPDVLERIEAYTKKVGLSRNAAIHDLIEAGLEADRWAGSKKPAPTIADVVEAAAPAARAAERKMAKPGALEKALGKVVEKGLPIVRGSDPKLVTPDVPVAGGKMAEVRRDTFPSWMRGKK